MLTFEPKSIIYNFQRSSELAATEYGVKKPAEVKLI